MIRPHRALLAFVARAALVYGVFVSPWPGLDRPYVDGYRSSANALARVLPLDARARFHPAPNHVWDTRIRFSPRIVRRIQVEAVRHGPYMATALLVALVLATPLPWLARLRALFVGLGLLYAYLGLRLAAILLALGTHDPLPWLPLTEVRRDALLAFAYLQWYVLPPIAWFVAVAGPLRGLLGSASEAPPKHEALEASPE